MHSFKKDCLKHASQFLESNKTEAHQTILPHFTAGCVIRCSRRFNTTLASLLWQSSCSCHDKAWNKCSEKCYRICQPWLDTRYGNWCTPVFPCQVCPMEMAWNKWRKQIHCNVWWTTHWDGHMENLWWLFGLVLWYKQALQQALPILFSKSHILPELDTLTKWQPWHWQDAFMLTDGKTVMLLKIRVQHFSTGTQYSTCSCWA